MAEDTQSICHHCARKDLERSFHRYGGHVKLGHATLSVRKGIGGPVKLVHASLSDRKGIQKTFHNYGGSAKLIHSCFVCEED